MNDGKAYGVIKAYFMLACDFAETSNFESGLGYPANEFGELRVTVSAWKEVGYLLGAITTAIALYNMGITALGFAPHRFMEPIVDFFDLTLVKAIRALMATLTVNPMPYVSPEFAAFFLTLAIALARSFSFQVHWLERSGRIENKVRRVPLLLQYIFLLTSAATLLLLIPVLSLILYVLVPVFLWNCIGHTTRAAFSRGLNARGYEFIWPFDIGFAYVGAAVLAGACFLTLDFFY